MTLEQARQASIILEKKGKLETAIRDVKTSTSIDFMGGFFSVHIDETNALESIKNLTISIFTQKLNELEKQIEQLEDEHKNFVAISTTLIVKNLRQI